VRSNAVSATTPAARAAYVRTQRTGLRATDGNMRLATSGRILAKARSPCAAGCHDAPPRTREALGGAARTQVINARMSSESPAHDTVDRSAACSRTGNALSASAPRRAMQSSDLSAR